MAIYSPPIVRLALTLLVLLPTSAQAAGLSFYRPPSPLPRGRHGDIIRQRRLTGTAALTAARRSTLVLYRSVSPRGRAIAVSGIVSVPKGKAPKGGWPVVSYGHGNTGLADVCAPSRDAPESSAHEGIAYAYPLLNALLRSGYAVVRSDYEGLGTPGRHPDGVLVSEGRSMVDMVRAARQVDPRLSRRWVAVGHSQGGGAALGAGAAARRWAPELRLRGVDSMAPGGSAVPLIDAAGSVTVPSPLSRFAAVIAGAAASQGIDVTAVLTPDALSLLPLVDTQCYDRLDDADSWGSLAPADILKPYADLREIRSFVAAEDPGTLRLPGPVLVQQGSADELLDPASSATTARRVGARLISYPGVSHRGVLMAGRSDLLSFLRKRF